MTHTKVVQLNFDTLQCVVRYGLEESRRSPCFRRFHQRYPQVPKTREFNNSFGRRDPSRNVLEVVGWQGEGHRIQRELDPSGNVHALRIGGAIGLYIHKVKILDMAFLAKKVEEAVQTRNAHHTSDCNVLQVHQLESVEKKLLRGLGGGPC